MKEWVLVKTDRKERGMLTNLSQLQCPACMTIFGPCPQTRFNQPGMGITKKAHVFAAIVQREGGRG